ncbi:MAG: thiamine pyrophosphate-dependent enzyme, partial [Chlamydiota bacterium]|nr:thiamine pyrophosphate-dependent enzyme [Chlamydiota bacterium]
ICFLRDMMTIRQFEQRAEAMYKQGKIGGFFHAYTGQEAIQTAAVHAIGIENNWWITTYRCHALALLMGVTPNEVMCELYGKSTGNAQGRGGSMHLYSERMLGGFGIVGGHLPIATGAAFSLKYLGEGGVAVCFLGDGAVVQGAVHESLNLAALWDLPCIYVIENNQWGMGTSTRRAIAAHPIGEHLAKAYEIESRTIDGMDLLSCYGHFVEVAEEVKRTHRPVIIEAVTERFCGHSVSDPGLYRTKESLSEAKSRDPLVLYSEFLEQKGIISSEEIEKIKKEEKERVLSAIQRAEEAPEPDEITLGEGIFAP